MTIRKLLQEKDGTVTATGADTTVQEIMNRLELDEVSAIVVTDAERRILGIVSAGDILRALNGCGREGLERAVADVMTTDVFTCDVSEPLSRVYELMDTNRIRHVPIVENDQLCGIVNTLDVVKHRLRELASEAEALKEYVAGRT